MAFIGLFRFDLLLFYRICFELLSSLNFNNQYSLWTTVRMAFREFWGIKKLLQSLLCSAKYFSFYRKPKSLLSDFQELIMSPRKLSVNIISTSKNTTLCYFVTSTNSDSSSEEEESGEENYEETEDPISERTCESKESETENSSKIPHPSTIETRGTSHPSLSLKRKHDKPDNEVSQKRIKPAEPQTEETLLDLEVETVVEAQPASHNSEASGRLEEVILEPIKEKDSQGVNECTKTEFPKGSNPDIQSKSPITSKDEISSSFQELPTGSGTFDLISFGVNYRDGQNNSDVISPEEERQIQLALLESIKESAMKTEEKYIEPAPGFFEWMQNISGEAEKNIEDDQQSAKNLGEIPTHYESSDKIIIAQDTDQKDRKLEENAGKAKVLCDNENSGNEASNERRPSHMNLLQSQMQRAGDDIQSDVILESSSMNVSESQAQSTRDDGVHKSAATGTVKFGEPKSRDDNDAFRRYPIEPEPPQHPSAFNTPEMKPLIPSAQAPKIRKTNIFARINTPSEIGPPSLHESPAPSAPEYLRVNDRFGQGGEAAVYPSDITREEAESNIQRALYESYQEDVARQREKEWLNQLTSNIERAFLESCLENAANQSEEELRNQSATYNNSNEPLASTSKYGSYPGLAKDPLKVKKDARFQKKFYKEPPVILPRNLGQAIREAVTPESYPDALEEYRDKVLTPEERDKKLKHKQAMERYVMQNTQVPKDTEETGSEGATSSKKHKEVGKSSSYDGSLLSRDPRLRHSGYVASSFAEESPSISESSNGSRFSDGEQIHPPADPFPPPPIASLPPERRQPDVSSTHLDIINIPQIQEEAIMRSAFAIVEAHQKLLSEENARKLREMQGIGAEIQQIKQVLEAKKIIQHQEEEKDFPLENYKSEKELSQRQDSVSTHEDSAIKCEEGHPIQLPVPDSKTISVAAEVHAKPYIPETESVTESSGSNQDDNDTSTSEDIPAQSKFISKFDKNLHEKDK